MPVVVGRVEEHAAGAVLARLRVLVAREETVAVRVLVDDLVRRARLVGRVAVAVAVLGPRLELHRAEALVDDLVRKPEQAAAVGRVDVDVVERGRAQVGLKLRRGHARSGRLRSRSGGQQGKREQRRQNQAAPPHVHPSPRPSPRHTVASANRTSILAVQPMRRSTIASWRSPRQMLQHSLRPRGSRMSTPRSPIRPAVSSNGSGRRSS